jgi:hypothetical protein
MTFCQSLLMSKSTSQDEVRQKMTRSPVCAVTQNSLIQPTPWYDSLIQPFWPQQPTPGRSSMVSNLGCSDSVSSVLQFWVGRSQRSVTSQPFSPGTFRYLILVHFRPKETVRKRIGQKEQYYCGIHRKHHTRESVWVPEGRYNRVESTNLSKYWVRVFGIGD